MVEEGAVFKTNNSGDCVVVKYDGALSVRVRFLASGYECTTTSDQLRKGTLKDRLKKVVCGVGYLGEKVPYVDTVYNCWVNMIKRCYDMATQNSHPSYKGCTVCDEWHSFGAFYRWYILNHVEGFELDKDKKIKGNKIYSPEACLFVSKPENVRISSVKKYRITHKDGSEITIMNMLKFCRDNKLQNSGMRRVMSGERKSHKGWIKVKLIK